MTPDQEIDLRSFEASLPMALLRAREATMKVFRPLLADHGVTEQQWRVLRALTAATDAIDAGTLAERTFLLGPSLSRILVNLDDRELIVRYADPEDQRRSLIQLSDDGRALVDRIGPESEAAYNAIEKRYGAKRFARLMHELHELAALDLAPNVESEQEKAS